MWVAKVKMINIYSYIAYIYDLMITALIISDVTHSYMTA